MINLKKINLGKIEIEDKDWIVPILKEANVPGCHHNFGNLLAWRDIKKTIVGKVDGFLLAKKTSDQENSYLYPVGKGNLKSLIEKVILVEDGNFVFEGLYNESVEELEELFPGKFIFEEVRDDFDYVYLLEKLVSLRGKKLHRKRNHINNFKRNNPDWSFEPLTEDNIEEAIEMNKEWCIDVGCENDDDLLDENCATRYFFKYFEELELEGGLIRANGKVLAFAIGEVLNEDTYVVHIEKAFRDIQGAYPMINQQFVTWVKDKYPNIVYVNREEDMGLEGLRKAKLSYYPDKMTESYRAILK